MKALNQNLPSEVFFNLFLSENSEFFRLKPSFKLGGVFWKRPAIFLPKNDGWRRKYSLHCAKRNFTQKAQPFLPCHGVMKWSRDIFTKHQRRLTCLSTVALCEGGWSRSLWSLVKRSAFAASEVAACRRVDVFLFTALRLHGGKPPWFFASSMGYDKNSYLFCAWNFRKLIDF